MGGNGKTAPVDAREQRFKRLIEVGIALSAERNHNRLIERILVEAKEFCNADGGTLYMRPKDTARTAEDSLRFEIMRNDTLGVAMGGTTGRKIPFPPLKLYGADGKPNHHNVATHVALSGESINIEDAYTAEGFDFTGTKKFDSGNNYRSKSFLTVPLKNHDNEVIGVLQLINARAETGEVIAFSSEIQPLIEALSSQAAVALDNQQLLEAQKHLFITFIDVIGKAIDEKSPYTGGHCGRVPELTFMLAEAAAEANDGPFKDFSLSEEDRYELGIAGGLHDCGKVTTPEYVVDKATKLETIYNRIHEIRMRFEVLKRDAEIAYYQDRMANKAPEAELAAKRDAAIKELDEEYAFVAECNIGGEFMAAEKVGRLKQIGERRWARTLDDRIGLSHEELKRYSTEAPTLPVEERLLADKPEQIIAHDLSARLDYAERGYNLKPPANKFNLGELYNLSIGRGTLTAEDRFWINNHIVQTIEMLNKLPFPKYLRNVVEYAGGHHEKMDGGGYPRGLRREDMSLPARMMAIADIFEALTASDRPYKKPKTLSESIKIMSFMKKDQHVDPDLFELFLRSGVYKKYAERYLLPDQIDEVDVTPYLTPSAGKP